MACRAATLLAMLLATAVVAAQEPEQRPEPVQRYATVTTMAGQTYVGRVVAMNLEAVEIEVEGGTVRIPAAEMRSCRFNQAAEVPPAPASVEVEPAPAQAPAATEGSAGTPVAETPQAPSGGVGEETAGGAGTAATTQPTVPEPRITWKRPLPDPADPSGSGSRPVDRQHRSLLRARIAALDETYPWLAPTAPSQWFSLGLLLLVSLGLMVHMSVHVAGAEAPQLGRSIGLGVWYLLTGTLQLAMVPTCDLGIVLMLLGNSTMSLFWLSGLFGLPRSGAVIALLVQLGFAALVWGVLELVTALLGSVGAST